MYPNKHLQLFFLSLLVSCVSFAAFVFLFPFPHESKEDIYAKFVPWVATRTSLYTPYKYWWPLALAFIPGMTFVLWYFLSIFQKIPIIQKTFLTQKKESISTIYPLEIGIVCILLLFLLINFSYSAFYQYFYNYHHLNFIAGPISDILSGKLLLVNSKAQYGFLNIFLASFIFKYLLYFSHANIHFISMIMGFIEYLCVYLILRILTKNILYSISGLFFIIAIHFYGVFGYLFPSEIFVWPGNSVWRFFPAMPTALFLLLWLKTQSKKWFFCTQIGVVIGVLWNIEAGVPLALAYLGILFLLFWYSQESWIHKTKEFILSFLSLFLIFVLFMAGYSWYTSVQIGALPNWSDLYYFTVLFNSGFLQNKIGVPGIGFYYWPILIYSIVIFLTMIRKYTKNGLPVKDVIFLSFLAIYGYGIYRYYIGKQSSSDLAGIIIPAGLIFIYFFHHILQRIFLTHVRKSFFILGIFLIAFFIWEQFRFLYWTTRLFITRYKDYQMITTEPYINLPPKNHIIAMENTVVNTIPWSEVLATIKKIEKYIPPRKPIAIIGYFDHIILMQSERTNIVDYWYMHATIYTNEEVEKVVKTYNKKAPYIFVDKRLFRNNPTEYVHSSLPGGEVTMIEIFNKLRNNYEFVEDIGMLYVYKRK